MKNLENKIYETTKNINAKFEKLTSELEMYLDELNESLEEVEEKWSETCKKINDLESTEIMNDEEYENLCSKTHEYSDLVHYLKTTIDEIENTISVLGSFS